MLTAWTARGAVSATGSSSLMRHGPSTTLSVDFAVMSERSKPKTMRAISLLTASSAIPAIASPL